MTYPLTTIKTLSVTFDEAIAPQELECFRGAIVAKVGMDKEWYHNHKNAPDAPTGYHYRYPLIQYHLSRGRPRLLFINEAVGEARHFFTQNDWRLTLAGREYQSGIQALKAGQAEFGLLPELRPYTLTRWMGLNSANHAAYQASTRLSDKVALLERVLSGNILSMANGIGYQFPERFEVALTYLHRSYTIHYKGVPLLAFDVGFAANVALPLGLPLGKGGSLGFGRVGLPRKEEKEPITDTPLIF